MKYNINNQNMLEHHIWCWSEFSKPLIYFYKVDIWLKGPPKSRLKKILIIESEYMNKGIRLFPALCR